MVVFVSLLFAITGLYAVLMAGMARFAARATDTPAPATALPRVAVLVAARNEESRLPRCIEALLAQDYPPDRLDIYVADDHSTDGTAAVIRRYQAQHAEALALPDGSVDIEASAPRVHYVAVPDAVDHLRGKANAIHAAVLASDHEILIVTDADCAPPPGWARNHIAYFAEDASVGCVCGHTYVENTSPFDAVQALDWAYLLATTSVFVETDRPITAMGNNMALRREAYEAVGGYPALPFSVTEDYVLFKTIADASGFQVRYPFDPGLRNYTLPLASVVDMYQQRRRWARGGLRAPAWVYPIYALAHLAHLLPLIALFVAPVLGLGAMLLKASGDFALLWTSLGLSNRRGLLRMFPAFEAYLFVYIVTLPAVLAFFPRINWKDRKL